jgi:hypothetical protein
LSAVRNAVRKRQTCWVHAASFTFRSDAPEKLIETIWAPRGGWGYLKRRDLWIEVEATPEELEAKGFTARKPVTDENVRICRSCGLYICDVPGYLIHKHTQECDHSGDNWSSLEEAVINEIRIKKHHARILAEKLREQAELEELEKRERQDKIKEEYFSRQTSKDRKKRLKSEARDSFRNR